MDEFLKLNWSWKHILPDTDQFYNSKFTDDEKDVFYCHLHEIDHIHLLRHNNKLSYTANTDNKLEPLTIHKYIDPRTKKEVKQLHINHYFEHFQFNDHLFNRFHEKSKFSSFKHCIFLRVLDRLLIKNNNNNNANKIPTITDADRKDLELYMSTWESRQSEEICFQNFVQKYFYANLLSRCRDIFDSTANEMIQIEWQQSIVQIKQKFATFNYNLETAIPLNPPSNNDIGIIKSSVTSTTPSATCTSLTNGNNNNSATLVQLIFSRVIKKNGRIWQYQKGMVNSHLRNSYILPKKIPMPDNSASIPTQCLMSGVQILLNIDVIENILCAPFYLNKSWNIPFEIKEFPGNRPIVCFFDKPLPNIFLTSQYCNEKSVELKVHNLVTNIGRSLNLRDSIIEKNFSVGAGLDPKNPYKIYEYDKFSQETIKNKCYSSYMSEMYVLKNQTDELHLMIEGENDCLFEENEESRTFVNISTKCEYQCEFGAEKMSRNELIREWCRQRFKSGTVTDRFRVDITTSQITNVTRLTTTNIEAELLRLYKIKPTDLYQILWETLNIIRNFPPNSYLLSHNTKHGNKAMIYGYTDKKTPNTFSIEKLFKTNPDEILILDQIYWNPIDELHITQRHRNANILPCLFPPKLFNNVNNNNRQVNGNNNQIGRIGKKKKTKFGCKVDDRMDRINQATKKNQEKQDKIKLNELKKQNHRKQAKRKKRAEKYKAKREQQKCDNAVVGESIDPYEWFNDKGNISMSELKSTTGSTFTSSLSGKKEDQILVGERDSLPKIVTTGSSTLCNDYSIQAQCSLPNLL